MCNSNWKFNAYLQLKNQLQLHYNYKLQFEDNHWKRETQIILEMVICHSWWGTYLHNEWGSLSIRKFVFAKAHG